jgi:thioesterase domain-containing protein/acyl carrier protein
MQKIKLMLFRGVCQNPAFFKHVESIQCGNGGKLNRKAIQQIAETEPQHTEPSNAPRDALEIKLLAIWKDVLSSLSAGIEDNFFDSGGDSLLGAKLLTRIYEECEVRISLELLYRYPNIAGLAAVIHNGAWNDTKQPCIVMKPGAPEKRLFMFPGAGSDIILLRDLAASFKNDVSIIGCQYPGLDGKNHYLRTVPEMALFFLKHLRAIQPAGPYYLAGISFGGLVAFETARQLENAGECVNFLGLLDTYTPSYLSFKRHLTLPLKIKAFQYWCLPNGRKQVWTMMSACVGLCQKIGLTIEQLRWKLLRRTSPYARRFRGLRAACLGAWKIYSIQPVKAPVTVFRAEQQLPDDLFEQDSYHGWEHASTSRVEIITVPGRHHTLMHHPHAAVLANHITREIHKNMSCVENGV